MWVRGAIAVLLIVVSGNASFAQGGTAVSPVDEGPIHLAIRALAVPPAGGTAQSSTQRESWVVRHPVVTGTLIGTGVGAILSGTDAVGGVDHNPAVMLAGAGVGAWSGLIASAVHQRRTGKKVGAGTKFAIIAGAVSLVVLPLVACYGAGGCGGTS